MIDLVFVLTNKLDVSVKEIRKIVAENQEINERKIEEMQKSFAENSDEQDSKFVKLKIELSELEGRLVTLEAKHELSETSLTALAGENSKLSEKMVLLAQLREASREMSEKFATSQQHQRNDTNHLLSRLEQVEKTFSDKLLTSDSDTNLKVDTLDTEVKLLITQTEQHLLHTITEDKRKMFEQIQKVQKSQEDLEKTELTKSSEVSELEEDIKENTRTIQSFDKKFEHFKELNEAVVNNLRQSIKNTENQFLIHEKDQKNQINFLENKINQKVYTHDTHKRAEIRFQELELTSNHLKNDLEILTVKFTDFKEEEKYNIKKLKKKKPNFEFSTICNGGFKLSNLDFFFFYSVLHRRGEGRHQQLHQLS